MSETADQQFERIKDLYTNDIILKRFTTYQSCIPFIRLLELFLTSVSKKNVGCVRVLLTSIEVHKNNLERDELYAEYNDTVIINHDNDRNYNDDNDR